MISRSPRDNSDARGVIREQHRTLTYNFARDIAAYRVRTQRLSHDVYVMAEVIQN